MAAMESLASSSNKSHKVNKPEIANADGKEGSHPPHVNITANHSESKLELFGFDSLVNILGLKTYVNNLKLELFGFDSLVNILGLKSMTGDGEQNQTPSSPRDGEDITITQGQPKINEVKSRTLMGVFVPCLQNIMGIIYYIRFSWIVGMAGIGESLLVVFICGLCTFLTAISLSAIATNGAMKGGGPYYLIGCALGPEVGVSIGLCFFFGTAVAGALYVLGAVETFLGALPGAGIFRETVTQVNGTTIGSVSSPSLHDLQVYGIVVTIIPCLIVFGGVKMINRVAPAFLIPVVLSLFCIFIGIFRRRWISLQGITGLSLETFRDNWTTEYQNTNNAGVPDLNGDISWNFHALVGLFFPAVTGITAGSNRSASLKDTTIHSRGYPSSHSYNDRTLPDFSVMFRSTCNED